MTLKFTKDHEWVKIEGNVAIVGITKHAADALGELVYVELPQVGKNFKKGDAVVVVESSKSASDVYTPINGEIIETNEKLNSTPEEVNTDPYGQGWLVKIKIEGSEGEIAQQLSDCLEEAAYKAYLQEKY